jgi:hypothetical protein
MSQVLFTITFKMKEVSWVGHVSRMEGKERPFVLHTRKCENNKR